MNIVTSYSYCYKCLDFLAVILRGQNSVLLIWFPTIPSLHIQNAWSGNFERTNCSSLLSSHITYWCVPTDLEIFIMNSSKPLYFCEINLFVFIKSSLKGKSIEVLGHAQKLIPKAMQGVVCTNSAKFWAKFISLEPRTRKAHYGPCLPPELVLVLCVAWVLDS